jgi:hypothetical protein
MFHNHDILDRLRRGEKRDIITAALGVGANTVKKVRQAASERGWLAPGSSMPTEEELEAALAARRKVPAPQLSSVEPYREKVEAWYRQGMKAMTIWRALQRNHGFAGLLLLRPQVCAEAGGHPARSGGASAVPAGGTSPRSTSAPGPCSSTPRAARSARPTSS